MGPQQSTLECWYREFIFWQGFLTKPTDTRDERHPQADSETYLYSISDNLVTNGYQKELAPSLESCFIPDLYRKHECSITETDCFKTAPHSLRLFSAVFPPLYDTMVNYCLLPSPFSFAIRSKNRWAMASFKMLF